jgi:hypothetical protein
MLYCRSVNIFGSFSTFSHNPTLNSAIRFLPLAGQTHAFW